MIKGLIRWIIDQARSHAASVGAGKPVESQSTEQDRIQYTDRPLLDFISQPAYLQDVALGTKKLRLETGEEIVILLQLYVLLFHHGLFVGTRSTAKHRDSSEQVKEHSFVS